jgi:hypothetical protein
MQKFHARFVGKTKGAIGVSSHHELFLEAPDADAAHLKLYETHEHIERPTLTPLVMRFAATWVNAEGMRTLMCPAQGRFTYPTPGEAQYWIDAVTTRNSTKKIAQIWSADPRFEVRPVWCWPGHHDPVGVYFDV